MPTPDFAPAVPRPAKSPLFGVLVAGLVSIPVWALVVVAVTYLT